MRVGIDEISKYFTSQKKKSPVNPYFYCFNLLLGNKFLGKKVTVHFPIFFLNFFEVIVQKESRVHRPSFLVNSARS